MRRALFCLLVLGLVTAPLAASAQDSKPREIVHGAYAKAAIGYQGWFFTPYVSYGTQFAFGGGYDFVDQLAFTVGAEGNFHLSTVNGLSGAALGAQGQSPVQGDFQSLAGLFSLRAAYNFGGRDIRRLSVFVRAGGGVWFSPEARNAEDPDNPILLGKSPHGHAVPAVDVALGLEYFTRLSHFSLGLEAEMIGLVNPGAPTAVDAGLSGFVPNININFLLKYTFGKPEQRS